MKNQITQGTRNLPITHGGVDREYKVCTCHRCNITVLCTPIFKFSPRYNDPNGPLYCAFCLTWLCTADMNAPMKGLNGFTFEYDTFSVQ